MSYGRSVLCPLSQKYIDPPPLIVPIRGLTCSKPDRVEELYCALADVINTHNKDDETRFTGRMAMIWVERELFQFQ
jgi:hypothetical protein